MSQNHSAQTYQEYASAILERLTRQDGRASLVQHSAENQNQSMQIWLDPFVGENEATESFSPDEYAMASARGHTNRRLA